ncbi:MAG: DUF357 domain-containing protein [Candidatus Anstonellales archaeon]
MAKKTIVENQYQRVRKDIEEFEELIKNKKTVETVDKIVLDIAIMYKNDAKYYLEKKDYFTAWGCINYAFGLIDSELKFKRNSNSLND